jgi:hypothetical protein
MGWSIDIESDREISESEIDAIVRELPQPVLGVFPSRQAWGWSLGVDARLSGNTLSLSGSYSMSGRIAELAAEAFARRLEKLGHTVTVGTFA